MVQRRKDNNAWNGEMQKEGREAMAQKKKETSQFEHVPMMHQDIDLHGFQSYPHSAAGCRPGRAWSMRDSWEGEVETKVCAWAEVVP